jgi:hypothetical protein
MPEFQLNADRHGKHAYYKLSTFAKGYVEAMFFTNGDTGDDNESLLNDLGVERLTREAVKAIAKDCDAFLSTIMPDGCFVQQWINRAADETNGGYDDERAGNDFWYTRQGHGVGYWCRDELKGDLGQGLADAARKFGEAYCSVARGWIYHN